MPEESRMALTDLSFFEAGIRSVEAATMDILRKVSANDRFVSVSLLQNCMGRINKFVKERVHSSHYDIFIRMVLSILHLEERTEDVNASEQLYGESSQDAKCSAIVIGPNGIAHLYTESRND